MKRDLFSQLGQVGLDVDDYVDRSGEPAVEGVFELFGDFVGGFDAEVGVNEYVKIEEDLSADGACAEMVILADMAVVADNLPDLTDGIFVDSAFGKLAY